MTGFEKELERLKGLKGGPKHMWLEQHRELVLQFHHEFGDEATKETFHLRESTLHNLLPRIRNTYRPKLTKVDRALAQAEIVSADIQQLRQEVSSLKQLFERFQLTVGEQLVEKFFKPLLQRGISIDSDLFTQKEEDKLSLKDFSVENPLLLRKAKKKSG